LFGIAPTRQLEQMIPRTVPIHLSGIQAKIKNPHMM